jgi:hypothetical protein
VKEREREREREREKERKKERKRKRKRDGGRRKDFDIEWKSKKSCRDSGFKRNEFVCVRIEHSVLCIHLNTK